MAETVLVVDDDPDVARFVEVNLRSAGYQVLVASNGEEALERAVQLRPDLVLLDVMMPGMTGYDVCRKIRENPATGILPVVMVTALDPAQERIKGLDAGADDFLTKPVNKTELLLRCGAFLRLRRQDAQIRRQIEDLQRLQSLKDDLFGKEEAVGKTVMIDNVPFLVIGVMQEKSQDSSYSGRDKDKAFVPETTYRGLFTERYVDNFIFQARAAALVPEVTRKVYEVLGRRHKFDPSDKEAIGMWDTTESEKFFRVFFGTFRAFLGIVGSFTLIVGGIGVSNIMYVVVEERTREIGIKLAVGAKPRFIQGQFLTETLTLTAVGGLLGFLITLLVMAVFPKSLDEYVGTPQASPLVILTTALLLGGIGVVAGWFPARRASMLDPVVALKLS